jgi:hypothetical protein
MLVNYSCLLLNYDCYNNYEPTSELYVINVTRLSHGLEDQDYLYQIGTKFSKRGYLFDFQKKLENYFGIHSPICRSKCFNAILVSPMEYFYLESRIKSKQRNFDSITKNNFIKILWTKTLRLSPKDSHHRSIGNSSSRFISHIIITWIYPFSHYALCLFLSKIERSIDTDSRNLSTFSEECKYHVSKTPHFGGGKHISIITHSLTFQNVSAPLYCFLGSRS